MKIRLENLTITFIGTGAVYASPVFGCECLACVRAKKDPSYKRQPASIMVSTPHKNILIDAGHPNLVDIVEKYAIDTILLTHYHPDHVQGLLHLRWGHESKKITIISPDDPLGFADLYKNHGILDFSQRTQDFKAFSVHGVLFTPLPLRHSKLTHGYLVDYQENAVVYMTDTVGISKEAVEFLNNYMLNALIIDCTFSPEETAKNHNNLTHVLEVADKLGNPATYLTHIGHGMDTWWLQNHESLGDIKPQLYLAKDSLAL